MALPDTLKKRALCGNNRSHLLWYLCDKDYLTDQILRMLHMLYQILLVELTVRFHNTALLCPTKERIRGN